MPTETFLPLWTPQRHIASLCLLIFSVGLGLGIALPCLRKPSKRLRTQVAEKEHKQKDAFAIRCVKKRP